MVYRIIKLALTCLVAVALLLLILWSTVPVWLPPLASLGLPAGTKLIINQRIKIQRHGIAIPRLQLIADNCSLADIGPTTLAWQRNEVHSQSAYLDIDTDCLSRLPQQPSSRETASTLSLADIQRYLPTFSVFIQDLRITPWQNYHAAVKLTHDERVLALYIEGPHITAAATLNNQQILTITSFDLTLPETQEQIELKGDINIPIDLNTIPTRGNINAKFVTTYTEKPLLAQLHWQQQNGHLTVNAQDESDKLLDLPWTLVDKTFTIEAGKWQWPYGVQPFSGGLTLSLSDWGSDYSQANLAARINMVTQGRGGKGNAVLTFKPGVVSLKQSALDFQLTGKINQEQLSLYISIPGELSGPIINPTLKLTSGALLRANGDVTPDIYLHEARLPLAGLTITEAGITGRLQTIIHARHRYWGDYKLHLDGNADEFWVDQGVWQWKFWGNGDMPPFNAKWDLAGEGQWLNSLVTIQRLSTGFDQLAYGRMVMEKPRLSLRAPLNWHRFDNHYEAQWQLQAQNIAFADGAYLPPATLLLSFSGRNPADFQWKGTLSTDNIGPINLNGRWDGERVRGQAWWPKQPLDVFQTLLSPDLGYTIRGGELYAQAAFSFTEQQGLEAGGHWVVNDGSMWLKDGELSGLDFIMSWRLRDHRWQLGTKGPIQLRIKRLKNLFDMRNITADLQGYYPYNERYPLRLTRLGMDLLQGHLGMETLRLPQNAPAILTVKGIELSELFTVLKPKQFAMSGKVNGELPFYLNDSQWLVRQGWVENDQSLTLRLDNDMVAAIRADNAITGDIIDWLRYMEISRSRADVNVTNLGLLTLDAQVKGVNPTKSKQRPIELNYHHQEDIFQLWRSLRFGDSLQDSLQQFFSLPVENER